MNVVVWARVSSREQREGYSLDAQLRAMRDKAAKHGWTIVREFVIAESAKRGADRKVFNDMLRWVKKNAKCEKIDVIFAHKLDRVCRNMRDAVRLQELEDDHSIKLTFVENDFGPGAAGALSFNVMAAVAQYYSDNLRSEVLKGMDEKVRQGWPTGLAPFGYLNVRDKNEPVIPHPERSKALARLFELYAGGQYTFESLADKLAAEGHVYRKSQSRFNRTAMSRILGNRFYIGELHRGGNVYQGRYRQVIDRFTFDTCQDILHGKNRRTGSPNLQYAGGLFHCKHCGSAITGERIKRKLGNGGIREHIYYRCGNNSPLAEHPRLRWRESDLESAIIEHLEAFKFPSEEMATWFRGAVEAMFADREQLERNRRRALNKRRTDLANMQERLLNTFLGGTIEESTFSAKSVDFKAQQADVEQQLCELPRQDLNQAENVLKAFNLSQNMVETWRRSNSLARRELLDCISLNRSLSDVSLYIVRRKPFDIFAERPFLENSRGERI